MSHLYSMFAKQVSAHCKSAANELPVALCKRDLLVYGIGRLERMSDVHLDAMDPYQRGVNDLSKYLPNPRCHSDFDNRYMIARGTHTLALLVPHSCERDRGSV